MLTTCPECRTHFRVTQAQLDVHRGMVRCGHCQAVFNGYDTLLPEFEAPPRQSVDAPAPQGPEQAVPETLVAPASAFVHSIEAVEPRPAAEPPAPAVDEVGTESDTVAVEVFVAPPAVDRPAAVEGRRESATRAVPAEEGTDAILFSEPSTRRRAEGAAPRRLGSVALNALLVLLLFAQAAYFLRVWIVNQVPEMRPWFVSACAAFGCELPRARQLGVLRVEASSLETDPEQPTRARLDVTFSNRSRVEQVWPHFILKLTDVRGTTLAQRVFGPGDYLPAEAAPAPAMAPMSEQEFKLDLDLGDLNASGYEVSAHYP